MKRMRIYFELTCKTCFQAVPGILAGVFVISLLLGGLLFVCHQNQENTRASSVLHIGIAAQEQEPYLDWMISAIQNMKSLEFNCQFTKISPETSEEKLLHGKLDAVFIIPKDYIASLIQGSENPLVIRFGTSDTTIAGFFVKQIGEAASRLMINTQAGIYTMKNIYQKEHIAGANSDELSLNLKYLDTILHREKLVSVEEVPARGGLTNSPALLSSGIVLFLLFCGLVCPGILRPESKSLQEKLFRCGIRPFHQVLLRYLALTLLFSCLYLILSLVFSTWISLSGGTVSDSAPQNYADWLFCFLRLYPLVFPVCALILFTYGLARNKVFCVLFLFLLIIVLGYLSGCFYPLSWLPQNFHHLSALLPVRHMLDYTGACLAGGWSLSAFLYMNLYSLVLISGTLAVRIYRRRRTL
ncbi:MAG: ABC transporter permease [Eubacterium sp.]|nr:ABC transporter permease [Eubacterium sp.]